MPSLIAYRKFIDTMHTRELRLPNDSSMRLAGQELCTLADGRTVVVLEDGSELPAYQPAEIKDSIEQLPTPLPTDLRDAIRDASPHVQLINERVRSAIGERYSMADEIKLLRTAPSPEMEAYNAYAEECRAWGRAEKAKLGL